MVIYTPTFTSLWNDRLVMVADTPGGPLRIAYRKGDSVVPITIDEAPTQLDALVQVLSRVRTRLTSDPLDRRPTTIRLGWL